MKPTRFVLVPRPRPGSWFRDMLGVGRGLWATVVHILETPPPRPDAQAAPGGVYLRLAANGAPMCVACGLCTVVCPPRCLTVDKAPPPPSAGAAVPLLLRFEIDEMRCISCARCVQVCPENALDMTGPLPLAETTRQQGIKRLFDVSDMPPKTGS